MAINAKTADKFHEWDIKLWLWVFLCSAAIFSAIPLARSIQKFTYHTAGRDFFTYSVLFVISVALLTLLYFLFFKLSVKSISQYIWLFFCSGLYVYFTFLLRKNPEESVHLIEYGLLAFFVFKALNHRIRDWTVYVTSALIVSFIGTVDEFIQWMIPGRYWDYRDIGINMAAGVFFLLTVSKGVKPDTVYAPPERSSVRILAWAITLNLVFIGLCLSNTPDSVNTYTSKFSGLSWLRSEEPMTEYGHIFKDNEIGTFHSRFTEEELKEIDLKNGEAYGKLLTQKISPEETAPELLMIYTPYTNPFLHEFLIHVSRINNKLEELSKINTPGPKKTIINTIYTEYKIIEKYFKTTLRHSEREWLEKKINDLQQTAPSEGKDYVSKIGANITSFNVRTAWLFILITLAIVWISSILWQKMLAAD